MKKRSKYRNLLLIMFFCSLIAVGVTILNKIHNSKENSTDKKQENKVQIKALEKPKEANVPKKEDKGSSSSSTTDTHITPSAPAASATTSETSNFKDFFSKDLFFGDSITEGISFYEILNDENVAAIKGMDTVKAAKQVNDIIKINPKNIYILIGENDIDRTRTAQQFADHYCILIESIRKKCPNSKIYIQSILPITAEAEKADPSIGNDIIDEYNVALKNLEKKEGVTYINIAALLKNHQEYYEQDGEHVKTQFYSIWLNYIKSVVQTSK